MFQRLPWFLQEVVQLAGALSVPCKIQGSLFPPRKPLPLIHVSYLFSFLSSHNNPLISIRSTLTVLCIRIFVLLSEFKLATPLIKMETNLLINWRSIHLCAPVPHTFCLSLPYLLCISTIHVCFYKLGAFPPSSHLPVYLVAAFAKRLARLALTAPPESLLMVLPFIYNLIRRHPSCRVLIHRPTTADGRHSL